MNPRVREPARRPAWLKVLLALGFLVCLLNVGAYVYGLTLPNQWSVEQSVVVQAPPDAVYPHIASAKQWTEWSSWSPTQDPTLELAFEGPDSGEGSTAIWRGEMIGLGRMTITAAEQDRNIRYKLALQNQPFTENGQILLEAVEGGTRITWTDSGELDSTLGRLFRERLEASVATEFRASLKRLKETVERDSGG